MQIIFKTKLTRKVILFSMPIKLKIKLARKSSPNLDSFAKNGDSWEFLFDHSPISYSFDYDTKTSTKTLLLTQNLSFNDTLMVD